MRSAASLPPMTDASRLKFAISDSVSPYGCRLNDPALVLVIK